MRTERHATSQIVPSLVDGAWIVPEDTDLVRDPYRGGVVAEAPRSTRADCDRAIASAHGHKARIAAMPPPERAALLRRSADLLSRRERIIATTLTRETGKPLKDSLLETRRAADALRRCGEEILRLEWTPVLRCSTPPIAVGRAVRFPLGVVSLITPWETPVLVAAMKVGAALGAGNAVVVKASARAPLSMHETVKCFVDAGVPGGIVNALYGEAVGRTIVADRRVDFVSFTGWERAGALVRAAAGMKRVALDIRRVPATVVHPDADVDAAAGVCARYGLLGATERWWPVRNVYVHCSLVERFMASLITSVNRLVVGDPLDERTDVGTLIDEAAARGLEVAIADAAADGAEVVAGGTRQGAQFWPTVLFNADQRTAVVREELGGPALSVIPYGDMVELTSRLSVAHPRGGFQLALFTGDLHDEGAVGTARSRAAIHDMSEERSVVFN